MSWDIDLHDDRGHVEGSWNYTHNTTPMIWAVLETSGETFTVHPDSRHNAWNTERVAAGYEAHISWYMYLDAQPGAAGARFLDVIVRGLEADPSLERLNPANGWGSYATLLDVLRSMRKSVPEWPTVWTATG